MSKEIDDDDDFPFRKKSPWKRRTPFDDIFGSSNRDFDDILHNLEEFIGNIFTSSWKKDADFSQPFIWGLSFHKDSAGKTKIEKFGNRKDSFKQVEEGPTLREPLTDVLVEDDQIRVIVEIPGIEKEDIDLTATSSNFYLRASNPERQYSKELKLPEKIVSDSAKAKFKNGVLEVVFKKAESKKTGSKISVD
ncbi:MAG: archaeal heat shock protein Hsp20 [Candidatus Hodarchaeales archaeon]|jgi:HSP20 family protein